MANWRHSDPETSRDAALSIDEAKVTKLQKRIYDFLRYAGPMTDEELVNAYLLWTDVVGEGYASPSGIRSRRHELVNLGLVCDTGTRAKLRSGRQAIVWKVAA